MPRDHAKGRPAANGTAQERIATGDTASLQAMGCDLWRRDAAPPVSVSTGHVIRLRRLDRERPVQPGGAVLVDLGDAHDVSAQQAWRIRNLVAGAASVQLRGSTGQVRDWIATVLVDNPDVEP